MPTRESLILVGSSVRAAAQSAVRAGFDPWCIDQFGDRDLTEIAADTLTISDWPHGIESVFQKTPSADWIYTGAVENAAELVARLSESRRLLGCGPDALKRLRDPHWLAQTLTRASLPTLPVAVPTADCVELSENPAATGPLFPDDWMLKPRASAAGIGVRQFNESDFERRNSEDYFLQQKAIGRSISGLYLGFEGSAQLLGMCEQLCRGADVGAGQYVYAGSLGPLSVSDVPNRVFDQAQQIGSAIVDGVRNERAQMSGLFGIDFILDEDCRDLWTLEVNPRYTASAELYERAFGWPLMKWHVDACRGSFFETESSLSDSRCKHRFRKHGKLIVYARQEFIAPDFLPLTARLQSLVSDHLSAADIPQLGTLIQKDEPVCTLFGNHESLEGCHELLMSSEAAIQNLIESKHPAAWFK
ncbi:MAG: ATP-grasp domain-containing protein [Rhodopirellula sp.]|nr:ATP-grasp domain-containing protein [Rhodopirellula sp.]